MEMVIIGFLMKGYLIMAFRSIAQMEKFKQLVKEGKMDKTTFDTWAHGTILATLPQRITPSSPKAAEHPHAHVTRHARKQRKKRARPARPKSRTKRVKRKERKKRTMPL
jgi:hypothetical protein